MIKETYHDIDKMPTILLKNVRNILLLPLAHLIIFCFSTEIGPDDLKEYTQLLQLVILWKQLVIDRNLFPLFAT